jgi:hypothetical protein
MCLIELYCNVDDFWKAFKQEWNKHLIDSKKLKRGPEAGLTIPEMMTIVILYHQSNYRCFKHFYFYVCNYLKKEFPNLVIYSRFIYLMKSVFVPLFGYLLHLRGMITAL